MAEQEPMSEAQAKSVGTLIIIGALAFVALAIIIIGA